MQSHRLALQLLRSPAYLCERRSGLYLGYTLIFASRVVCDVIIRDYHCFVSHQLVQEKTIVEKGERSEEKKPIKRVEQEVYKDLLSRDNWSSLVCAF